MKEGKCPHIKWGSSRTCIHKSSVYAPPRRLTLSNILALPQYSQFLMICTQNY